MATTREQLDRVRKRLLRKEAIPSGLLTGFAVLSFMVSKLGDAETAKNAVAWIDKKSHFWQFFTGHVEWIALALAVAWLIYLLLRPENLTRPTDVAVEEAIPSTPSVEVPLSARDYSVLEPPEVVVFVKAWLHPTFQIAIEGMLLPIRNSIRSKYGVVIEDLYQMAVVDRFVGHAEAMKLRMEGRGPRSTPLIDQTNTLYREYEEMIRKIYFCGALVDLPYSDSVRFKGWQSDDVKTCDKLRELIALPEYSDSDLAKSVKEYADGGVAKEMRVRLANRPPSPYEGGTL